MRARWSKACLGCLSLPHLAGLAARPLRHGNPLVRVRRSQLEIRRPSGPRVNAPLVRPLYASQIRATCGNDVDQSLQVQIAGLLCWWNAEHPRGSHLTRGNSLTVACSCVVVTLAGMDDATKRAGETR